MPALAISTTTLLELRDLFEARIRSTVPVVLPQQANRWKVYRDATDTASKMRRARVILTMGTFFKRGYFTNRKVETTALLRVRVDYARKAGDLTMLIQSDWHQLRERLATLTADPVNGLVWLETTTAPPTQVAETNQGRSRISTASLASTDFAQVDLTYDLRYMRAREAAA